MSVATVADAETAAEPAPGPTAKRAATSTAVAAAAALGAPERSEPADLSQPSRLTKASAAAPLSTLPWPLPPLPPTPLSPPPGGFPVADLADLAELARMPLPDLGPVADVLGQLDAVQVEVDALRSELNLLRRRDETLNFYIHRLDEELRLAAKLQQDFLPKVLPEVGPVRFHTLYRPAGYVSGDLYDVSRLDERRVGFYVADAVGHGMPAALLAMFIKHALVTKEVRGGAGSTPRAGTPTAGYRLLDPGEALARLNTTLVEQELTQATFATALYGVLDGDSLCLSLAKAGHPSPLLLRADGSHEWLDVSGPLLGIFPDESFPTRAVQLSRGDRVVLYTDGIEVAFADPQNPNEPRWQEELLRRARLRPEQLLQEFAEEMDREPGSLDPRDDLTMMVIEVEGEGAEQR